MSFPGGSLVKKKNLPTVQETQETRVRSLVWEDPLEEEMATHSCQENLVDREAWQATVHGDHRVRCDSTHTTLNSKQVLGEQGVEMWICFTMILQQVLYSKQPQISG